MYRSNSNLKKPVNTLQPLWRYMKYEYVLDLLSSESLYFPRLSSMADQWEGLLTIKTKEKLFRNFYAQYADTAIANSQIEEYEKHREEFFTNCWHMNDSESYLMWKVYANRGCAIESTFERLQISFDGFPGEIEGGTVDYIDYRRETIQVGNIYFPVAKKDLPYRDEREFRLLFLAI